MKRRDRKRRVARKPPYKDPKPVILVVTEGKVTEPEYLNGFARACRNSRVRVEVVGGAGAPKTMIEAAKYLKNDAAKQAKREKDDNLAYDEVWCVFDVDEHPNIPASKQMARDNGLKLAISNPCIELWLCLHFADQPGMKHRHTLQKKMKQHVDNYDKHVDFSDYESGYNDAVKRASRLDDDAKSDNDDGRNPTTGVWRLTESIRKAI